MENVDTSTVLDLLVLIDDDRRYHETASVMSTHPVQRAHFAALSRKEAALVSTVRQGMARLMCSNPSASQQARQLDAYTRLLVDTYLYGGSSDVTPPHSRKRSAAAQTPQTRPEAREA